MIQNSINQMLGAVGAMAMVGKRMGAEVNAIKTKQSNDQFDALNKLYKTHSDLENHYIEQQAAYDSGSDEYNEIQGKLEGTRMIKGMAKDKLTEIAQKESGDPVSPKQAAIDATVTYSDIKRDQAMQRAKKIALSAQNQSNGNFIETSMGRVYERNNPDLYNKLKENK